MIVNKPLLVLAFVLLGITILAYFLVPNLTGLVSGEIESNNVKLATFAVCENQGELIYCKDKLFASCNGSPIEVNESTFYCNGEKYNASNLPLGETFNVQTWNDPRQKDFITAWASSD